MYSKRMSGEWLTGSFKGYSVVQICKEGMTTDTWDGAYPILESWNHYRIVLPLPDITGLLANSSAQRETHTTGGEFKLWQIDIIVRKCDAIRKWGAGL